MRVFERIVLLVFALVLLVFVGAMGYDLLFVDHKAPIIESDSELITVSVHDPEEALLQGITAVDKRDGDLTEQVMVQSVSALIDSNTAKVSYVVFDQANNMASYSRKVQYSDYEKPRFSLDQALVYRTGGTIELLDRLKAVDVLDGNISNKIRVTAQNVDISNAGTYEVTVQVTNSMGDTTTLPLTVVINDYVYLQVIRLSEYLSYVDVGADFDPADYVERVTPRAGFDGSVEDLSITSNVNTKEPGIYEVEYRYDFPAEERTYTVYQTVIVE